MSLRRGISANWEETQQAPDLFVERGHAHAWFGWSGDFGGGYDGHTAWAFAPGEQPKALEGSRAITYPLDHRLDRDAHLDGLYPKQTALADRAEGGRREHAVRMTTTHGSEETWYFDAGTGLLTGIERIEEREKTGPVHVRLHFDDYRDVDGVRVPFRRKIDEDGHAVVMTIQSIVNNVSIDTSAFALPAEASRRSERQRSSSRLPTSRRADHPQEVAAHDTIRGR